MQYKRFSGITSFVLVYMLLAFIWWSVLLFHKNRDAYQAKIELQQMGMMVDGLIQNKEEFFQTNHYQELQKDYESQEVMILGEAIALSLSLIVAMLIVYRSYRKEIKVSQLHRNFLLSITHELKSPIASVRLSLETIAKQHLKLQSDQIQRLSNNGINDADRLNKLVEDILLSARLESAHKFHKEEVDLSLLLTNIYDDFSTSYLKPTINLSLGTDIPMMTGDVQALRSMITNLIENAIKYSSKPANIELGLSVKEDDFLELTVADQGMGIPKKEQAYVFNKFYRIGHENTRKTKGTGLGLFIVYEIVKGHGGKISISSNQPQGSIFTVLLPL